MSQTKKRVNYSKPARNIICDLINQANPGRSFQPTDLTFGVPRKHVAAGGDVQVGNTDLDVTVNATEVTTTVNYGRMDLAQREGLAGGIKIPYTGQLAVSDCLEAINEIAGLPLTAEDVINTELEGLSASTMPYTFDLKARDSSLIVIGRVDVTIVAEEEEEEEEPVTPPVEPEPEPIPGILSVNSLVASEEIVQQDDVVNLTLNLTVEGDTPVAGPMQWTMDMTGLVFTAPVQLVEGLTATAQAGTNKIDVFATTDLDPGSYTLILGTKVDLWGEQDPEDEASIPADVTITTTFTAPGADPAVSVIEIESDLG